MTWKHNSYEKGDAGPCDVGAVLRLARAREPAVAAGRGQETDLYYYFLTSSPFSRIWKSVQDAQNERGVCL